MWPWVVGVIAAGVLVALAAVGGAGWWLVKRANRGADADAVWQTHALPESPEVAVEFPGPAGASRELIDVVNPRSGKVEGQESFPVFKCELPNDESYAVRVETVPWFVLRGTADARTREDKLMAIPSLLRGSDWRQFQRRYSVPCGGYVSDECVVPTAAGGRSYVFRSILVEDRVYTLFVGGRDVSNEQPRVQRFFDSFRHARIRPEATVSHPPIATDPDELRLLARVAAHNAVVFAPRSNAVFVSCGGGAPNPRNTHPLTGERVPPLRLSPDHAYLGGSYIVRYHYPSFRLEAGMPVTDFFFALKADEKGGRIVGVGAGGVVAHTLPAPVDKSDWGRRVAPVERFPNTGMGMRAAWARAPDGGRMYMLLTGPHHPRPALRCFDLTAMTWAGELSLPDARDGLTLTPDGTRLYAVTGPPTGKQVWFGAGPPGATLHEIDAATLRVRRTMPLRSELTHLAAIGDGRLLGIGGQSPPPNVTSRGLRWPLIDLTADPPGERLLSVSGGGEQHVVVKNRLYATSTGGSIDSWDVSGGATGRITRAGSVAGVTGGQGDSFAVSPDGKCLIATDGRVYWLAGAGPLPEVDQAARWKP